MLGAVFKDAVARGITNGRGPFNHLLFTNIWPSNVADDRYEFSSGSHLVCKKNCQ